MSNELWRCTTKSELMLASTRSSELLRATAYLLFSAIYLLSCGESHAEQRFRQYAKDHLSISRETRTQQFDDEQDRETSTNRPSLKPKNHKDRPHKTPSLQDLLDWNKDWLLPHESLPLGVNNGYDWFRQGRLGAGNNPPKDFKAMIGWGQIFWERGSDKASATIELRNFNTFVCSGPNREWTKFPSGEVTGAIFRADYVNNVAERPSSTSVTDSIRRVTFTTGGAYHFWPASGRATIPKEPICGIIVMLEAREVFNSSKHRLLVGLGGDYWKSAGVEWNQYKTNKDWAVSRLKWLSQDWKWYGMSTAAEPDLARLDVNSLLEQR